MTERANLLIASPYNDERKRFSNLFAGHDIIDISTCSTFRECMQQIDKADLMVLSWELGDPSPPHYAIEKWANRRNGPMFITTQVAKTQDECHKILGNVYQKGVLMYLYNLDDAGIMRIITSQAKCVIAVKENIKFKSNSELDIIKNIASKPRGAAVLAILSLLVWLTGLITPDTFLSWLAGIFG